jgi:hypothetical protein
MKVNRSLRRIFKIVVVIGIAYFLILPFLNWFIGYHGYEKEKFRRNSWGDIQESKTRGVFVKKLNFIYLVKSDTVNVDSLNVFIEKGYKFGYFSANETNSKLEKTNFPFQISQTERTNHNLVVYNFTNLKNLDSIGENGIIYLKNPTIKDTLFMTVEGFRLENGKALWDSIGYVKVFEKKNYR